MLKKFFVTVIFLFIAFINVINAKNQPKIIIIGAGLSGISAATKLIQNGYDNILILEAENRIGGRIYSVKLGDGGYLDLGAQWVHGMGNNSIYELASDKYDFGATGFDDNFPTFLQSDGAILDQNKCQQYSEIALNILFSSYSQMSKYPGNIEDYFISKFKKEVLREKEDESLVNEFIDYFEKEMNIWNGSATWKDLSASLHSISGYNKGVQYLTWKRDGFQKVFEFLMHSTNIHKMTDVINNIKFNKQVANIQWNPQYENKMPIVTTTDGHKYFADHIIVTVSLGVLKDRYRTLFSPQLPKPLITAIHAMGYGNIGKIFLEFDHQFWPVNDDTWVGYGFLWTKENIKEIKGTKREWLLDLQSFTKVDAFPNILEALLAGPHMRVIETLSDQQIIDDCMWLFEKFSLKPLKHPKTLKRTRWLTNKNFLGSYSYYSMDAWKFKIKSKDLGQSLHNLKKKPEILFAGEHTDELYSSNAHGAVNSGFRVANELIKYYF